VCVWLCCATPKGFVSVTPLNTVNEHLSLPVVKTLRPALVLSCQESEEHMGPSLSTNLYTGNPCIHQRLPSYLQNEKKRKENTLRTTVRVFRHITGLMQFSTNKHT